MTTSIEHALLAAAVALAAATAGVVGSVAVDRSDAVVPTAGAAVHRQTVNRQSHNTAALRRSAGAFAGDTGRHFPVDAVGDPDDARHVVVLVPGTGADAARHPDLVRRAAVLADAMRRHHRSVAVVAWTGYRAPRDLTEAAGDAPARRGSVRLHRYLRALHAAPGGRRVVTVVGHSYGAVVAARAAAAGAPMRRLVLVGAPGFGRPFRTSADLARPDIEVWSAMTHDDPVALVHRGGDLTRLHGGDTTAAASGALRLPTDAHVADGRTRPASAGHSGYFDIDSAGLENLARVAVGRDPVAAVPPHRTPSGPP